MRHVLVLLAAALATAVLPGQDVWQSFDVEVIVYSEDDLAFGEASDPYLEFSCDARAGERYSWIGKERSTAPEPLEVVSRLWGGSNWRYFKYEGSVEVGSSDERVAVRVADTVMKFADTYALLRLIREADDPLQMRLIDGTGVGVVETASSRSKEFDVCRIAYACGDQDSITAACRSTVQPPAPSLKLLKQDIQTLLDRYPTN